MEHIDYFKPYDGNEPFIFISYAHADSSAVMKIITDMHDRGFRIWYDEGIEVGSEWTECIASHLSDAGLMIGFVSNNYIASDNCRREMNYAVQKKKQIINVYLSETSLTPGLELQIGGIWALMKYTYPNEPYFFSKLYEAPALCSGNYGESDSPIVIPACEQTVEEPKVRHRARKEKRRPAPPASGAAKPRRKWVLPVIAISLAVVLLAAASLWTIGKRTGFIDRAYNRYFAPETEITMLSGDTVANFKSELFEQIARDYCGIRTGEMTVADLSGLTSLFICGDEYSFTGAFTVGDISSAQAEVADADGGFVTVSRGSIYDLSDLRYFTGLTRLQLVYQSLGSLDSIPECAIEELDISANRITSLNGAARLPNLRELNADGNPITDIGDLAECLGLTELRMNGSDPASLSSLKVLPALSVFRVSNCTFDQLRLVLHISTLTQVELYNCDLRGDIFDILDGDHLSKLRFEDCAFSTVKDIESMSVSELWLIRCTGINDWSTIAESSTLTALHIDESMQEYFSGSYIFKIIVEQDV